MHGRFGNAHAHTQPRGDLHWGSGKITLPTRRAVAPIAAQFCCRRANVGHSSRSLAYRLRGPLTATLQIHAPFSAGLLCDGRRQLARRSPQRAYVEATRSGCFPNGGVTCVVAADCIATTPHVAHPRQTHAGDDSRSRSGLVFGRSLGDSVPCAHPRLEGACVCDGCRGRGGGSPSPSEPPRPPALAAGGSAPGGGAEGAMGLPPARAPLAGAAPAGPACSRSPSRRGRRTC